MLNKRKIVIITGVTSFLGKSVAKYLLSKNFIVYGIIRPESKRLKNLFDVNGLNLIKIDFNNKSVEDISNLPHTSSKKHIDNIRNSKCDISVIHFGWGATLDRANISAQEENIEYSKKVLEFAKILGAKRLIFAGSQAEMSGSAYGMAKYEFASYAEKELMGTMMQFIHMRIFSIYGKDDRENSLLKQLVVSIKNETSIALSTCNFMWNFLYIDDFVKIVYLLITKNVDTGTYDLASDDTRLLKEYVLETKKVYKSDIVLNFGYRQDSSEKFAIPDIRGLIEKIGKFKFTKFKKGILNI